MQLLLQRGADVNARGGRYGSALQAAKVAGRTKIAEALVDAGEAETNLSVRHANIALENELYKSKLTKFCHVRPQLAKN
ncbi:hypothetical protein KCU71_g2409, partial [Aureobasidium melanogenum]